MTPEDLQILKTLTVPIPDDEEDRLHVLRSARIMDSDPNEPDFDRYTSLVQRLFKVRQASRIVSC